MSYIPIQKHHLVARGTGPAPAPLKYGTIMTTREVIRAYLIKRGLAKDLRQIARNRYAAQTYPTKA